MTDSIRVSLGRRWYRPTYAEAVAREDLERFESRYRELRVVAEVTFVYTEGTWPSRDYADVVAMTAMSCGDSTLLWVVRTAHEIHAESCWLASRDERRRLGISEIAPGRLGGP